MGFRFRRTLKIMPGVRLNLSRSGASVSMGPRGFHYTVGPKGTRVTAGIPGSGLSWTAYQSRPRRRPQSDQQPPHNVNPLKPPLGSKGELPGDNPNVTVFESAAIEELVAASTSELAPLLNAARSQLRFHTIALVLLFRCSQLRSSTIQHL
jgi:hypothetical protein